MTIREESLISFEQALCREEKSAVTIKKYRRDVKAFAAFAGQNPLNKDVLIAYKQHLQRQGYATASINSMLASVNCYLRHVDMPSLCVKQLRTQRSIYCPEEQELTKEEYFRLVAAAQKNKNHRMGALLQTICGTGIRISELRFFTLEAVKAGRVDVCCKNKNRVVLIPSKLRELLLVYAEQAGIVTGTIFVTRSGAPIDRSNVWSWMKTICRQAQVPQNKVFPHNLRKLFARTFYESEKDIATLADILGHSSINTTRIYIVSSGQEHKQKIENMGLVV